MTEVKRGAAASMGASEVRRWLPWIGGLLGLQALAWVLRSFDFNRFRSILAGADPRWLIPLGFGTIARSWLVARREELKLASVLATVALDRLTDGIVFACLVPLRKWNASCWCRSACRFACT